MTFTLNRSIPIHAACAYFIRQFAGHHRNYGIRRTCYLKMFTRFTNFTFYALRKQFAKRQIQVYLVCNIHVWARADLIVNIKIYARIITSGNVNFVFMKTGRGQHKIYTYVLRFMFHVATANCLIQKRDNTALRIFLQSGRMSALSSPFCCCWATIFFFMKNRKLDEL